ncbi:MAG: acetylglucosamine-6-sulfatase [Verrucomicrobiales bacterium]|nr:acetylglucosamine-6-sulfatase [Verrucomicrobiales bacterium]|tara:strand:- start:1732 stop:3291 length:1560 start_codon:yes stop_codon:yes gene_type:complete
MHSRARTFLAVLVSFTSLSLSAGEFDLAKIKGIKKRNILFILCDDHRYDAFSFMGHPYLETPHLDRMAKTGAHFENAFVTTSLCSPSRASILTGLYAHNHRVVDNYNPVDPKLRYFPQYLQKGGYETAFIGKWHMGDDDTPQRGFDYWLSFKGQGTYWPDGRGTTRKVPQNYYGGYNINGKKVPQKGYITDELTDFAINWMSTRRSKKPFFLYLSHKAVHADFVAHDRHKGRYKDQTFPFPKSYHNTEANYRNKPMWLKNQRNSRHGVDYAYNLRNFDLQEYHQRYCETLLAMDESVGRIMTYLEETGMAEDTLLVYMGDNGFQFGEHGLIDKRVAYEHSIKVPLLMHCPDLFQPGTKVPQVVANIDIGPTLLAVAGLKAPGHMDGSNFMPVALGNKAPWRTGLLYEYFWEWNYPHTPTMHAIRGDRYKYIRYHGLWDVNELYDIKEDPEELNNLIFSEAHQDVIKQMNKQLWEELRKTGGDSLALKPDRGLTFPWRLKDKAQRGDYPESWFRKPPPVK